MINERTVMVSMSVEAQIERYAKLRRIKWEEAASEWLEHHARSEGAAELRVLEARRAAEEARRHG